MTRLRSTRRFGQARDLWNPSSPQFQHLTLLGSGIALSSNHADFCVVGNLAWNSAASRSHLSERDASDDEGGAEEVGPEELLSAECDDLVPLETFPLLGLSSVRLRRKVRQRV